MNFYPPSSPPPTTPPMMDHSGPPANHPIYPWLQSQQMPQSREQYIPSTSSSHVSNITFPSTSNSYTQNRVVNDNYESKICGQQTDAGMVNGSRPFTIPLDILNQQTTLEALLRVRPKEVIFLGPHPNSIELFLRYRDVFITKAIHLLKHVQSLEKLTFSLDFTDVTRILETLAAIPDMQEIELTLPTASVLQPHSRDMLDIQRAFIAGLEFFWNLKRLTIPMEFVTSLLLSHLAMLPNLESLTVNYSPPPRPPHHHQQFPAWSSSTVPAECPGYVFLAHLNFDPRGYFRRLKWLDLRAPLSDTAFTTLRTMFPKAHIC